MHWYALRSKPNKELPLWRELRARQVDCFYPQLRVQPVNPRSRTSRPYFPGYLFLRTNLDQLGISTFQRIPFSQGLVSFGGEPASVPDALVHAIRRRVDQINTAGGERLARLKRGDVVIIQGGYFDGYQAIFNAHLPGSERVCVFLKVLEMRQMKLELSLNQIQQLQQKQP